MCGWLFFLFCTWLLRSSSEAQTVVAKVFGLGLRRHLMYCGNRIRKGDQRVSRPEEFVSIWRCCSSNGSITTPPNPYPAPRQAKRHPHRSRDALKQKGLICSFCAGRSLYLMSPTPSWERRCGIHSFIHFSFFFFPFQLNQQKRLHIYIALATELYAVCGKWISKAWPTVGTL